MSELVPAENVVMTAPTGSVLTPLTDPNGGTPLNRLKGFAAQPGVRRMLPWFLGVAALGGVALTWGMLAPTPQRVLYSQLGDGERAGVVDALDKAAIPYEIDNQTGALTVGESDFYRARMLVASDGALVTPESGSQMLDSLPMGASRTLEGERLRAARERDLQLTIAEIDGVESVRVHLADGEQSVFVRDNAPPTASVMVRLARGRQLSESQVSAVVNLVAASQPGLAPEAVRVVDQHGRLLSDRSVRGNNDRLELQQRMEEKLRTQVAQLLTPMLGEGNFTSEIQVDLDMDQVTSARESYDKDGSVRSETQQQSTSAGGAPAVGVPGALSNTPPPPASPVEAPPQGTQPAPAAAASNGESSSTRTYELGREVSVANTTPGNIKRLSIAVAISASSMKGGKPADIEQMKQLVGAAVGANAQRGDQVTVIARNFEPLVEDGLSFYEEPWFATVVRSIVALLAVLLVLLLGVRPLIKTLRRDPQPPAEDNALALPNLGPAPEGATADEGHALAGPVDQALLSQHVGLAQRLVAEKPDSAVVALRQMLNAEPSPNTLSPEPAQ